MADVTGTVFLDAGDHWDLPLTGATIDQICCDYAVGMRLSNPAGTWVLRIEQSFVVTLAEGTEHLVDPEEGTRLDMVLTTLRSVVAGAKAFKDGALAVVLEDGARIEVPPDEGFEAWELAGPSGARLVSLPGGETAVWSPE